MKVKVGGTVYDSEKVPVMVVLSKDDKRNIANMAHDATKYAIFPDEIAEQLGQEGMLDWMHTSGPAVG